MTAPGPGCLVSVNVGGIRTDGEGDRAYETAIGKRPVSGDVRVRGVNVDGDDQADRANHGGVDRALYAYAEEDYAWWSGRLERTLEPGVFGENLTTRGLDANAAVVGERWVVGDEVELEVSLPRVPCFKLANRMGDPHFVKTFGEALRPGPYLRIAREGTIRAGDPIVVRDRPAHGITIADVARGEIRCMMAGVNIIRVLGLASASGWVR